VTSTTIIPAAYPKSHFFVMLQLKSSESWPSIIIVPHSMFSSLPT